MTEYQVLARKYRPQQFRDVLGQEAIVNTLKNAIKYQRLAHAYLFCGSRGTGKTTLARVFAKALNCLQPTEDLEPCNQCKSCKEITSGSSLDVLEIDGASHRGIDDIRQINETVGYAAASGKYKIYIIDEVHMLTKEAFNALLKTLEEPPLKVKFFFATTEAHKVLPTILSRCQRFNLNRIPLEQIVGKLSTICQQMNIPIEQEAVRLIAARAEGGLRDAESLLDQIISFSDGSITTSSVAQILGIMPKEHFFELDVAGKEGNLAKAFEISHQLFFQGKDLQHFVENLTEHFRNLLLVKLSADGAPFFDMLPHEKAQYQQSAEYYTKEQCLSLIDFLIEAQGQMRFAPSSRIAIESILLRVLRIHQRMPIDTLIRKLGELEQKMEQSGSLTPPPPSKPQAAVPATPPLSVPKQPPLANAKTSSMTEDPSPSLSDLPKVKKAAAAPTPKSSSSASVKPTPPSPPPAAPSAPIPLEKQRRYDTLLHFAAVELEGNVQKKLN